MKFAAAIAAIALLIPAAALRPCPPRPRPLSSWYGEFGASSDVRRG